MAEEDLVGRTLLGRYRVLSHLGAGGMGSVYLARTEGAAGFAKPVVLKQIHSSLTVDPSASAMFVREARILSDIQHPGIVNVVDFGEASGRYVMVLEYVHGYDLAQWASYLVRKHRPFALKLVVHLSQRVLEALHHAHTHTWADGTRMSIVHRDVSPGNVLLGLDGQVKLADFGIARICDDQVERQVPIGPFKGKFAYSAPELLEGASASPQSDVYAWGVVVYQLLSGSNPFRDKLVADTVRRVLSFVPPPLSQLRRDLPTKLDAVLARALAKNREERYANAAEFAHALKRLSLVSAEEGQLILTEAVRRDFLQDMPAVLDIVPLTERESSWRDDTGSRTVAELVSLPPPADHEGVTVVESTGGARLWAPQPSATLEGLGEAARSEGTGGHSEPSAPLLEHGRPSRPPPAEVATGSSKVTTLAVAVGALSLLGAGIAIALALRSHPNRTPQVLIVDRRSVGSDELLRSNVPASSYVDFAAPPSARAAPNGSNAPLEAEREPGSQVGAAANHGALEANDAQRLSRAVQARRFAFVDCFERHVERVEGAPQLTLKLTVSASGQVERVIIAPTALAGTPLGGCVQSVAQRIAFPSLGREVTFSVPITAHASR